MRRAYTAKPGDGACGAGDLACGGLVEAAEVMGPGDSLTIGAGTYPGAVFVSGGLTITGDIGVTINSTVEFRGAVGGVSKFARVIVAQASGAGPGVLITGSSGVEITDSAIASKDGDGVACRQRHPEQDRALGDRHRRRAGERREGRRRRRAPPRG